MTSQAPNNIETYLAAAALEAYEVVKAGATERQVDTCGMGEEPIGIAQNKATAAGQTVGVAKGGTCKVTAAGAISYDDLLVPAELGKVTVKPSPSFADMLIDVSDTGFPNTITVTTGGTFYDLDGVTVSSNNSNFVHIAGTGTVAGKLVFGASSRFNIVDGDINTTTDVLTETAHGMSSGQRVRLTSDNSGFDDGTLPTGLSKATDYYINAASANTFTLHTTRAAALAGTGAVDITAAASGHTHYVWLMVDGLGSTEFNFNASASLENDSASASLIQMRALKNGTAITDMLASGNSATAGDELTLTLNGIIELDPDALDYINLEVTSDVDADTITANSNLMTLVPVNEVFHVIGRAKEAASQDGQIIEMGFERHMTSA